MSVPFDKVLVANRGEIAIRVFRSLTEMGIASVGVYSEADRDADFVGYADEAYLIGPPPATESYLVAEKILEVAERSGAQAVHPGYGFLAENAGFARSCAEAGIVFIGPPPEAIDAMGNKIEARSLMESSGVPIVPGVTDPVEDVSAARAIADDIGYPVAVKAAAGGGGKGFRVALTADELQGAFEGARRESEKFFADSVVYLERYLREPRHVEVQILADTHGRTVHLGERDCSVQRRHQKLVEESPSPVVDADLRERMGAASIRAAEAVGYTSAGTLEYLVSGDEFFFLEMNTRIQVEHTVTEMVTGVDLVREQIRVAAGEPLSVSQDDIAPRGHAFECRINAEDPARSFMPAPAPITRWRAPEGPGIRLDSGVSEGSDIPDIYDPMIAKLVVHDVDRESARRRMLRALNEFDVAGPRTLIPFHRWLFAQDDFIAGGACHAELAALVAGELEIPGLAADAAPEGEDAPEMTERMFTAEVSGRRFEVALRYPTADDGAAATPTRKRKSRGGGGGGGGASADPDAVLSPMQGTVLRVDAGPGDSVDAGQVVAVIEAMKMENEVTAHRAGTIAVVEVEPGASVSAGAVLVTLEPGE